MHFKDSKTFQNFLPCPHVLGAILGSFGFISVRPIKASAETIHTSSERHFPARQAIYEHFNLLAASDIYGGCDRPQGINLLSSTHLPATSRFLERE